MRNVITHLQLVADVDKARMGELGVIGNTQPFWHMKEPAWFDEIDANVLETQPFIEGVMNIAVLLRSDSPLVFRLFSAIFTDEKRTASYLSSELVVPAFLLLGLTPECRPAVVETAAKFVLSPRSPIFREAFAMVFDSLLSCRTDRSADHVAFCVAMLHIANGVVLDLPAPDFDYTRILSSIVSPLQTFGESELLLREVVLFHARVKTINRGMATVLSGAFQRVFHGDPDSTLFEAIASIFCDGSRIANPEVGCTFLSAYWNSPDPLPPVQCILSLCQRSRRNCILCHQAGLDLHLIAFMKSRLKTDCPGFIECSLRLFVAIAIEISSTAVLCAFVSLLCPIDVTSLSRYHLRFVGALADLARSARHIPAAFFELSPDCHIHAKCPNSEFCAGPFAVSFRLFCESFSQVGLLHLRDDSGAGLSMWIDLANVFHVQICHSDSAISIPLAVPLGRWFDLNVSFVAQSIRVAIDEENSRLVPLTGRFAVRGPLECFIVSQTQPTAYRMAQCVFAKEEPIIVFEANCHNNLVSLG
jgi:hypothetical protein